MRDHLLLYRTMYGTSSRSKSHPILNELWKAASSMKNPVAVLCWTKVNSTILIFGHRAGVWSQNGHPAFNPRPNGEGLFSIGWRTKLWDMSCYTSFTAAHTRSSRALSCAVPVTALCYVRTSRRLFGFCWRNCASCGTTIYLGASQETRNPSTHDDSLVSPELIWCKSVSLHIQIIFRPKRCGEKEEEKKLIEAAIVRVGHFSRLKWWPIRSEFFVSTALFRSRNNLPKHALGSWNSDTRSLLICVVRGT